MSNNQMVSVPREQMERFSEVLEVLSCHITVADDSLKAGRAIHSEMSAILAQPAEQHQGEPVAVVDEGDDGLFVELIYGDNGNPLRRGDKLYTRPAQGEVVGWQFYQQSKWWNGDDRIKDHRKNTEAAGIPTRDVYTHADPAEVERLREENRRLHEAGEFLDGVNQGIEDKLRAQLADAHALLRRALNGGDDNLGGDIDAALSANAEPTTAKQETHDEMRIRHKREFDALDGSGFHYQECRCGTRGSYPVEVKHCVCGKPFDSAEPSAPVERDQLTRMLDAAMVEMSNIHPPLGRGECASLIRAEPERKP